MISCVISFTGRPEQRDRQCADYPLRNLHILQIEGSSFDSIEMVIAHHIQPVCIHLIRARFSGKQGMISFNYLPW